MDWSTISVEAAEELQLKLSEKVILEDRLPISLRYVAGVDAAYTESQIVGAVAVFEYTSMRMVEQETSIQQISFPYVSTLLAFREMPPLVSAINQLHTKPDVILVDGQGYAHPKHFGLASHLGLIVGSPSIGVAKSLLCGEIEEDSKKDWKPIVYQGKIIGAAISTNPKTKPIYVSIGHKVSLKTAILIVRHCTRNYRVPIPIREAHLVAQKIKRKIAPG